MTPLHPPAHCASVEVAVPARAAFDFMADGLKQTHWALGSWNRRELDDGVFVGTSRFTFEELYVRLEAHPELLLVDYHGGSDPDDLHWIVQARIVPGDQLGIGEQRSLVTLTTWRHATASDAEWDLTYHLWHTEVALIKGRLEYEAALAVS
ncbi:MAG: hypothetical protein JWQ48_3494 [Conexibacter sp.]|nr:hypothetical protein [Conexibacter sp.]